MTLRIAEYHTGEIEVRQSATRLMILSSTEQRELLDALARYLGVTLTYDEATPPTESAWVVIPQAPGMQPVSEDDGRPTGYNMLPCKLEVAQEAAKLAGDVGVFRAITSITDAFRVACANYNDLPAYIIDHGNGAFSVIV